MVLRTCLVLIAAATFLPAQRSGEGAMTEEEQLRRKRAAIEAEAAGQEKDTKGVDDGAENLTPEQMLARNVRHGATNLCRFHAAAKPAKLMPGQSGTIVVTAVLQGDAVLPSPPPLEVIATASQGVATLGAAQFKPAAAGKIAKAYAGRPVYDNTADIEIPVAIAPTAAVGQKQMVSVEMRFDLYDGNSAQVVGRFIDRASVEIEVGQLADPVVRFVERSGSGAAAASVPPAELAPVAPAPANAPAIGGSEAKVVQEPDPPPVAAAETPAGGPPGVEGDSVSMPLWIGGGVLLLGLLGLLLRRK